MQPKESNMATKIANLTSKVDGSMEGVFATLRANG